MEHADMLRFGAFLTVLTLMLLWEARRPYRVTFYPSRRWINLAFALINAAVLRLFVPMLAVGVAIWAEQSETGLFNRIALPAMLSVVASIVLLDLLVYWQHRVFHRVPMFWRFHAMHHSDLQFDTTTGLRFHPLEIVFSMLLKMGGVVLLGAPVVAVVVFEILLNASSLFTHGNISFAKGFERRLRMLLVTPDMHRIHHSSDDREHHRNFGFLLSCWDRLFGSYCDESRQDPQQMPLGLQKFRSQHEQGLVALLLQPFRGQ